MLDLDVLKESLNDVRYPHFIARYPQLEVLRIHLPRKRTFATLDPKWYNHIATWPKTLTKLSLNFDGAFLDMSTYRCNDLFPALEYLTIKSFTSSSEKFMMRMPETLQTLNLHPGVFGVDSEHISKWLPRGLQVFKFRHEFWKLDKALPMLPPALGALHLDACFVTRSDIHLIPRQLQELSITLRKCKLGTLENLDFLSQLPQDYLTTFKLFGTNIHPTASSLDCAVLPPDLEVLFIQPPVQQVQFEKLSRSITSLEFSDVAFPSTTDLQQLPHYLNRLTFGQCRPENVVEGAAAFSVHQLPRSLTALNMGTSDVWKSFITDSNVLSLPPLLTSLTHFINDGSLTSDSFAIFPRSLRELRLQIFTAFDDIMIKDLPIGLKYLELADCTCLGDDCVPLLPRGLRSFTVHAGDLFTAACVPDMPPSMEEFNLGRTPKGEITKAIKLRLRKM